MSARSCARAACAGTLGFALELALAPCARAAQAIAAQAPEVASDTRSSLRLLDAPAPWVLVLVVLPLLVLACAACYAREPLPRAAKWLLGSLRFLALACIVLVLCRPVRVLRREEVLPAQALVLVDDSASMLRRDAYPPDSPSAQGLQRASGLVPQEATRLELARAALEQRLLPRIAEGGYALGLHAFAQDTRALGSVSELSGRGSSTRIGDALASLVAAQRGRHVTDLVLVSDGRATGGLDALDAARAAAQAGIALHTLLVGDARELQNASLELVEAPVHALAGDELLIAVRALGRGLPPGTRAEVALVELDEQGAPLRTLDSASVTLGPAGERVALVAPPGSASADARERRLRVELPLLEGETLQDDNRVDLSIALSPEKVRVLYVEGYPRYEYRFLALDLLKRSDENLRFQAFLLSSAPDFRQECSADLEPLREVPTERAALLDNYDVVLLGDFGPYDVSPDPARAAQFWDSLVEFVEGGGGLAFLAGEASNPRAYAGTRLEELLPVVLDPAISAYTGDTTRAFRPTLESPSQPHELARLHADAEQNRRLWEDEGGLSGQFWYWPVARAKPAAEVVLRHPQDANEHGRLPLLVAGHYPAGRTLFIALDSTWRWRHHYGNRYLDRFWRGSIRWLALGRLRSGDRRTRLEATRASYALGERVELEARVLDQEFRPSAEPSIEVRWGEAASSAQTLVLPAAPDRPGSFRGALEPERPGSYRAWIEIEGRRLTMTEFEVVPPSLEQADPSPDPRALAAIAALGGGRALELARIDELASEFPGGEERREPVSARLEDLWDHWLTLALALGLLSVEWILRKRMELP